MGISGNRQVGERRFGADAALKFNPCRDSVRIFSYETLFRKKEHFRRPGISKFVFSGREMPMTTIAVHYRKR